MLNHEEILKRINDGDKKLERVAKKLKKKFVGFDFEIVSVKKSISHNFSDIVTKKDDVVNISASKIK